MIILSSPATPHQCIEYVTMEVLAPLDPRHQLSHSSWHQSYRHASSGLITPDSASSSGSSNIFGRSGSWTGSNMLSIRGDDMRPAAQPRHNQTSSSGSLNYDPTRSTTATAPPSLSTAKPSLPPIRSVSSPITFSPDVLVLKAARFLQSLWQVLQQLL